jgi:hypothetical protein
VSWGDEVDEAPDVCTCGRGYVMVCLNHDHRLALLVAMNDLFESSSDVVTIEAARRFAEALDA